jgi:enoyl-CoA hydratase/carnithine racemase
MELKATLLTIANGVATITLNRPHRRNAWTGRMHTEYRWCVAQAEANPTVRVLVVTGAGDAFCVGGDSEALAGHVDRGAYDPGLPTALANPGYGVHPQFDQHFAFHFGLRLPVIAHINGACAGVGLVLASFCDLRYVESNAKLTTAAPKLGLPAEYGLSWLLPRLIGVTRAADLLLSGRIILGKEAAAIGLCNEAIDGHRALADAVTARAAHFATAVSPAAVEATKRQMYLDLIRHDVGTSVVESEVLLSAMMAGGQYREGVAALREKRQPNF